MPDAGLWEFRGRQHTHTYSAVLCWAACDRLGRIAGRLGLEPEKAEWSAEAARTLERRFELQRLDFEPRVFYRLTSNWLEMNLRFMSRDHGTRAIKDLIARDVLDGLDRAGIRVACVPYRVVEMPPWPPRAGSGDERDEVSGRRG